MSDVQQDLGKALLKLWVSQRSYNSIIRSKDHEQDFEYWMQKYILGAVAEVDEILQEINWKAHRRGKPTNFNNLGRELADLTKYVISMWDLAGFDAQDLLKFSQDKSDELEAQYEQDWLSGPEPDQPVIIFDIDGTLGDWRKAFISWCREKHQLIPQTEDGATTLALEVDLSIPYQKYVELKASFESEGGYRFLNPYPDTWDAIRKLEWSDAFCIAYTARPHARYSRIWSDTWGWLKSNRMAPPIRQLFIGQEERIGLACQYQSAGHKVVLVDDDPGTGSRALNANIPVVMRKHAYNKTLQGSSSRLTMFEDFSQAFEHIKEILW